MTKFEQYAPHAIRTSNGWIRVYDRPAPRKSWLARLIAWLFGG